MIMRQVWQHGRTAKIAQEIQPSGRFLVSFALGNIIETALKNELLLLSVGI